jgi:hypothetical protein
MAKIKEIKVIKPKVIIIEKKDEKKSADEEIDDEEGSQETLVKGRSVPSAALLLSRIGILTSNGGGKIEEIAAKVVKKGDDEDSRKVYSDKKNSSDTYIPGDKNDEGRGYMARTGSRQEYAAEQARVGTFEQRHVLGQETAKPKHDFVDVPRDPTEHDAKAREYEWERKKEDDQQKKRKQWQ